MKKDNKTKKKGILIALLLIVIIILLVILFFLISAYGFDASTEVSYSEFQEMWEAGDVKQVVINFNDSRFMFYDYAEISYATDNPDYADFKKDLLESGVEVKSNTKRNLITIGINVIVVIFEAFFMLLQFLSLSVF